MTIPLTGSVADGFIQRAARSIQKAGSGKLSPTLTFLESERLRFSLSSDYRGCKTTKG